MTDEKSLLDMQFEAWRRGYREGLRDGKLIAELVIAELLIGELQTGPEGEKR